jgi:hypothetical protein
LLTAARPVDNRPEGWQPAPQIHKPALFPKTVKHPSWPVLARITSRHAKIAFPPILTLSEWQTLLAAQAGAAATLTGLVFVAVSINLGQIIEVPGLPGRAGESIVQFLQVFFVTTVALVPRQPHTVLALEILAIGIASWVVQVAGQIRYWRSRTGHSMSWLIPRVIMSQFATVPFCVAGVLLLFGNPDGLYWLVPGFIFSFVAGVFSAWVLLVEILR